MVAVNWLSLLSVTVASVGGSLVDLGAMVSTSGLCFTTKLWKSYGCFCGLGQCSSGIPVDCLDSCCAAHDDCYSATPVSNAETFFLSYNWRRTRTNRIICKDCGRGGHRKKCRKCQCDRKLALCLRGKPCPGLLGATREAQCPATLQQRNTVPPYIVK